MLYSFLHSAHFPLFIMYVSFTTLAQKRFILVLKEVDEVKEDVKLSECFTFFSNVIYASVNA